MIAVKNCGMAVASQAAYHSKPGNDADQTRSVGVSLTSVLDF